ncbi:MAG TPA: hypothetical protein VF735_15015 [Pyrinomonadaceae bacterium]
MIEQGWSCQGSASAATASKTPTLLPPNLEAPVLRLAILARFRQADPVALTGEKLDTHISRRPAAGTTRGKEKILSAAWVASIH